MQSLNIFMQGLLDYAGLFPPANLPLQVSLKNFSEYYDHQQTNWLGKYILPVNKVDETISILNEHPLFSKLKNKANFSLIISNSETINDYSKILEKDITLIKKLTNQFEQTITLDSIEFAPPKEVFTTNNTKLIIDTLNILLEKFSYLDKINQFYCEVRVLENLHEYIQTISNFNQKISNKIAIKLRTGGVTPAQIPPSIDIAKAIRVCAEQKIPIKATAGLHVPVPNDNPHVGARLHGFLNIFSCLLLCYDDLMSIENMENIISNYSYRDFKFTDSGLHVGNRYISNQKMTELRKSFIKSFGTCSFIEPIDHLKENHIL